VRIGDNGVRTGQPWSAADAVKRGQAHVEGGAELGQMVNAGVGSLPGLDLMQELLGDAGTPCEFGGRESSRETEAGQSRGERVGLAGHQLPVLSSGWIRQ